jgi:Repeat of Unknown Function (DUF347)
VLINRRTASKVPDVTGYFWTIKSLSTTVGETIADTLNVDVHLGLTGTSAVMAVLLVGVMAAQFTPTRYLPAIYWLAVVLVSIVGTLITDLLTDGLQVSLQVSAAVFTVALIAIFAIWWGTEHTLVHPQHRHGAPRGVLLHGRAVSPSRWGICCPNTVTRGGRARRDSDLGDLQHRHRGADALPDAVTRRPDPCTRRRPGRRCLLGRRRAR